MSDQTMTQAIENLTGDYQLDPAHTRLGFVARHAMVTKVRGQFNEFDGSIHIDADDPSRSTAEIRIVAASITTNNEQRDGHLKNADFFDVETYPEITFTSTSAERLSDDEYRLVGDLTIKGVTKPVTVDLEYSGSAKDPFGNLRAGFEGKAEVNRKDWGVTWNAALETGGFLVGDKIKLELDVSAVKATPEA
jgi:polyisoprenoid-binding protein YceI